MSVDVIGGADGPTYVFLARQTGLDWINIFGAIIILLLLLPNIVYAIKFRNQKNKCINKRMILLEQIGRYASMFLMVFNIGITEFGFKSVSSFLIYVIGNLVLIITYWVIWIFYFHKQNFWKYMMLAIIPTVIFLMSGFLLVHIPLIISAAIFGISHIYVTYQNAK